MKRSFAPALAAAAALALVLAGCTVAEVPSPSDSPTPSAIVTPSPSETPSAPASATPDATPVAFDCPAWDDAVDDGAAAITPTGYAGICLGASFAEATERTGAPITPVDACPWYGQIVADDELGFYVSAVSYPEEPGEYIWVFSLVWLGEPEAAASYEMPATPEGITVGSTATNVLYAYPDAREIFFDDPNRGERLQIVVDNGDDLSYNFDIQEDVVNEITWGIGIGEGGPRGELCGI